KNLPASQYVFGGNAIAFFDEEIQRGLRNLPKIEDSAAGNFADHPEKFLQPIRTSQSRGRRRGRDRAKLRLPRRRSSRATHACLGRPVHARLDDPSTAAAAASAAGFTSGSGVAVCTGDVRESLARTISTFPRRRAPSSIPMRGVIT